MTDTYAGTRTRFLESLLVAASVFLFAIPVAEAALWAPGATLDPGCAPTDNNCGVQSNVATGVIGQVPYYAASGNVLAATSTFTILANGNVGIGTTTPYSRLSVWGSGTGATSIFELTDSASTSLMTVSNNDKVIIGPVTTAAAGNGLGVGV